MKKNGFTLAELLGVIVILSLIAIITVPAVTDSLQKYKEKICYSQLDEIVSAARMWASEANNIYKLPAKDSTTPIYVTLETLSNEGYIDAEIQNPVTKELFDKETRVEIKRDGNKLVYTIDEAVKEECK